eukprot:636256-Rhodomonas_salina.2
MTARNRRTTIVKKKQTQRAVERQEAAVGDAVRRVRKVCATGQQYRDGEPLASVIDKGVFLRRRQLEGEAHRRRRVPLHAPPV